MKNQKQNLSLFRTITGKTTHVPKQIEPKNPAVYQLPRVNVIRKFGGS